MHQFSFLKHAGVYALGDLLVNAGGMLLVPLYTRCLSRGEFDNLEILDTSAQVLLICVLGRGIPLAVFAFAQQSRSEAERRRAVGAAYLLTALGVLVGAALLLPLAAPAGPWLRLSSGWLLWAALTATLIDGLTLVAQSLNQARLDSAAYAAVSLGQFLVKVGLCVLFVAGFGWGVWGVVLASLTRALLFAAVLVGRELRRGIACPDRAAVGEMLAFALPFIPTGLGFFVLNGADRYLLVPYAGPGDIGLYGLGYKLAALVGLVSITPLQRVWSARMYAAAETPEGPVLFGRVTTWLLSGYVLLGLGLCLLQAEIIGAYAGAAFVSASPVVALIVLANGFQAAGNLFDGAFYVRRRTRCKIWITLGSTVVMLTLYAALIPTYGSLGAAAAAVAGFAFHAGLTFAVAQRVYPARYELGRLALMLLAALAVYFVAQGLGSGLLLVPVKLGLWLLWPVLLWVTGVIRPDEKQWLLAGAQLAFARRPALFRHIARPRP